MFLSSSDLSKYNTTSWRRPRDTTKM
jgi:hypothetical protein